jgi:hypothetical protein
MIYVYNPSTQETEAGESQVLGQPGLYREFKASLINIIRPSLKKRGEGGGEKSAKKKNKTRLGGRQRDEYSFRYCVRRITRGLVTESVGREN